MKPDLRQQVWFAFSDATVFIEIQRNDGAHAGLLRRDSGRPWPGKEKAIPLGGSGASLRFFPIATTPVFASAFSAAALVAVMSRADRLATGTASEGSPVANVLVIDDDPLTRLFVQRVLRQAGHDVHLAADGAEAMRLFARMPADLVICDIVMPGQGGLETILALMDQCPRPKIVAISASSDGTGGNYLPLAQALGANRTLRKPFTPQSLCRTVEDTLAL